MSKANVSTTISIPDDAVFKLGSFKLSHCYNDDLESVMIPRGLICDRIKRLAQEICDTIGDERLVLLCVLKSSFRFFTELAKELAAARASYTHPLELSFIQLKSYENMKGTGNVKILGLSNADELKDKKVLIVEDVVDSGQTMSQFLKVLDSIGVKQRWTVFLLSKRINRANQVHEDFVAFDIPDRFVVGYGLDYNQKFRDLEHICILSEEGIKRHML